MCCMAVFRDASLLALSNICENNNKTHIVQNIIALIDGHFMPSVIVANLKVKQMLLQSKSD